MQPTRSSLGREKDIKESIVRNISWHTNLLTLKLENEVEFIAKY